MVESPKANESELNPKINEKFNFIKKILCGKLKVNEVNFNLIYKAPRDGDYKEGVLTLGSDENDKEKNNALYKYVETYRQKNVKMFGGVLIPEDENWYFPNGLVDNIDSTNGWTRLELNNL